MLDLIDTWIKGADYFASLGVEYFVGAVVFALCYVVGLITRRERVHAVIAVAVLAYQISWVWRVFNTVS